MKNVRLKLLKACGIAGTHYKIGDVVSVTEREALTLKLNKQAEETSEPVTKKG